MMEMITRARIHLAVILVEFTHGDDDDDDYNKTKNHFQKAAREGLVNIMQTD